MSESIGAGSTIFQSGSVFGIGPPIDRSCLPASRLPSTAVRVGPGSAPSTVSFHSG